ncbi:hypothetical protein F4781DRAFT_366896 [Annulohypoxylon bovei var. microspora]|nr:hypothetical protein F4781DRAFT_366896 [Annulohypoxylon bovei var. microspora]
MSLPKLPKLSIGTDICQISRVYNILITDKAEKFVTRILTEEERSRGRGLAIYNTVMNKRPIYKNPLTDTINKDYMSFRLQRAITQASHYLAGRFAAKEAVMKAYKYRRLYVSDIVIAYENTRYPKPGVDESSNRLEEELSNSEAEVDEFSAPLKEDLSNSEEVSNSDGPSNPKSADSRRGKPGKIAEVWGPPIAIIRGGGIYEDVIVPISISHDGEYAISSCIIPLEEPKLLNSVESDDKQSEVD